MCHISYHRLAVAASFGTESTSIWWLANATLRAVNTGFGPTPTVMRCAMFFYSERATSASFNDLAFARLPLLIGCLWSRCGRLWPCGGTNSFWRQCLALTFQELGNNLTMGNWVSKQSFVFVLITLVTFALARAAVARRLHSRSQAVQPFTAMASMQRPMSEKNQLRSLGVTRC